VAKQRDTSNINDCLFDLLSYYQTDWPVAIPKNLSY